MSLKKQKLYKGNIIFVSSFTENKRYAIGKNKK